MNRLSKVKFFAHLVLEPQNAISLSPKNWSEFLVFLRASQLIGQFASGFAALDIRSDSVPKFVNKHLESYMCFSERQRLQVEYFSNNIAELLQENGIQATFLKGASYILNAQACSFGRSMNDIDILVTKDNLERAEAVFKSHGWQMK